MRLNRTLRVEDEDEDAYEIVLDQGRAIRITGKELDELRDQNALLLLIQKRIEENEP